MSSEPGYDGEYVATESPDRADLHEMAKDLGESVNGVLKRKHEGSRLIASLERGKRPMDRGLIVTLIWLYELDQAAHASGLKAVSLDGEGIRGTGDHGGFLDKAIKARVELKAAVASLGRGQARTCVLWALNNWQSPIRELGLHLAPLEKDFGRSKVLAMTSLGMALERLRDHKEST